MSSSRISHLEFSVFAEDFQILVGEPQNVGATGVDPAEVFHFHSETLLSIQTVSGTTVTLILQEWDGEPDTDPAGWEIWEVEASGRMHLHVLSAAAAPGGDTVLDGFHLHNETGRFQVRARAQGHAEVIRLEARGVDEWPDPGPERYLIQLWPEVG